MAAVVAVLATVTLTAPPALVEVEPGLVLTPTVTAWQGLDAATIEDLEALAWQIVHEREAEAERQRQAAEAAAVQAATAAQLAAQAEQAERANRVPPPPPSAPVVPLARTGDIWWALALCESGGNPSTNTGNGFYGAFQFMASTWWAVGGTGLPSEHSYDTQLHFAQVLQARSGFGQWPACARKLGLL